MHFNKTLNQSGISSLTRR